MIRLLTLILMMARPGFADSARVYSGEHADFTRLVIELPAEDDWTLGRTPLGYGFATRAGSQPGYDLSRVWSRIPKTRLQALRVDPQTGALQLTLACDCHVFPFEYQPGVIVLDIKPGPAPEGSAFETLFAPSPDGMNDPSLAAATGPGYDWLDLAASDRATDAATGMIPLPSHGISLDPLRAELLEQISRGAAEGVVDMALPGKPPAAEPVDHGTLPWSQIHIGPPPDTTIATIADGKESRTPEGHACVPDEDLDLARWGDGHTPLQVLADARSGLYGEFDTLDPQAALRAVRSHIYLGFGAEAAQYASLLSGTAPEDDLAVLNSLARLVDGDSDPQSPFLDMLACDGAAALWALAAWDAVPPGAAPNSEAIARSFLALPAHLRNVLGVGLAEKLLTHGDTEAARIIRNALERAPDADPAAIALLDATADLHGDAPEAAQSHAEAAIARDGSTAKEWIALVEAHFRATEPMPPDAATALRAFAGEIEGSEDAPGFFRALALAEMLSGRTEAGFALAEEHDLPVADLWQVAAALAEDDDFLRRAVAPPPPGASPEVAQAVASRLLGLGFPDAALLWLGPVGIADAEDRRRIAAAAELARGDARQSLALMDGLSEPDDLALQARAMVQLGQIARAREAYHAAGRTAEALRLATWEGAWPDLAGADMPLWSRAVSDAGPELAKDAGPLARGAAILEASATARSSIEALLAGVSGPEP